jgi:hypothetical protein
LSRFFQITQFKTAIHGPAYRNDIHSTFCVKQFIDIWFEIIYTRDRFAYLRRRLGEVVLGTAVRLGTAYFFDRRGLLPCRCCADRYAKDKTQRFANCPKIAQFFLLLCRLDYWGVVWCCNGNSTQKWGSNSRGQVWNSVLSGAFCPEYQAARG